jgi:GAF domain-containing protein
MRGSAERLEVQRLLALQETGLLASVAPQELQDICRRAKEHFGVAVAMVTLLVEDRLIVKAKAGTDLEEVPRTGQFCDYTIRSDEVFVVGNALEDPRFSSNPVVSEGQIRFYAGAPLIYRQDVRLGALCLLDTRPRGFSLGDQAELAEMADQGVGVIISRALNGSAAAAGL